MTGKEAYRQWAPAGSQWVDWARPVPFAVMDGSLVPGGAARFREPPILYITGPWKHAAIIVDTPGSESVQEGVALARIGFRPVPLYNGTNAPEGAMPLVEHHALEHALQWGAMELQKIPLPRDAPPAFLLDSNRTHRYKMNASVFDNSWDLYDQDLPSAEFFLRGGIASIVVRGERLQKDLARILYKFQQKGMKILFTDGYNDPIDIAVKRPPRRSV